MPTRPYSRGLRLVVPGAVVLVVAVTLAGCAADREPVPIPSSDTSVDPITQPRITPGVVPEFVEGGSAAENLDYFVFRLDALLAQEPAPSSRQLVDGLVESGFDKSAMEVTADSTPTGMAADSILIAVKMGEGCLLGQVDDGSAVADDAALLSTGRCLVGRTLSIDW